MYRRILILCCVLSVALTQTGCSGSFQRYLRGEYSGADGGIVAVSTGPYNQKGYDLWFAICENVNNSNERVIFASLGANPFAGKPDFENSNREGGTIILRRLAPVTYRVSKVLVSNCSFTPVEQIEFTIKPNKINYIGSYWLRIIRTEKERVVDSTVSVFGLFNLFGSRTVTIVTYNFFLEITDEWERDRIVVEKDSPDLMTMSVNKQVPAPGSGQSAYYVGNCSVTRP
jgi:hypothetical protein